MKSIMLANIHQPSTHIWEVFDLAIFLAKSGRVAYMNNMGDTLEKVLEYFSSASDREATAQCNPTNFVSDVISQLVYYPGRNAIF
jgi:hypothetical protein